MCGIGESHATLSGMAKEGADRAVGDRIAETRRQKALRQEDFLEKLAVRGVSWTRTTLSRIESGQRALKAIELFTVADALGISADKLNPESGSLPYAIQRQRVRYREATNLAESSAKSAEWVREGLTALLLANEIRSGNTAFTVHGTPERFMFALGTSFFSDEQEFMVSEVQKVLGLDPGEFTQYHIEHQEKARSRDEDTEHPDTLAETYNRIFSEHFPELKFVGDGSEALTVDGLEIGDGG